MLEKDAPGLAQLSADFAERLSHIPMASFVEQMKLAKANVQVSGDSLKYKCLGLNNLTSRHQIVDAVTGTMGGERYVPMQGCDHRTVCTFASRDNNYKLILGILREWCEMAARCPVREEQRVEEELSELQLGNLKYHRRVVP